jgi:hypothetical protein
MASNYNAFVLRAWRHRLAPLRAAHTRSHGRRNDKRLKTSLMSNKTNEQATTVPSKLLRGVTCENQTLQYSPVLFITFTYIFQSCLGAARGSHTKLNCIAACQPEVIC